MYNKLSRELLIDSSWSLVRVNGLKIAMHDDFLYATYSLQKKEHDIPACMMHVIVVIQTH